MTVCQLCLMYNRVEAMLRAQKLQQAAAEGPMAVQSMLNLLDSDGDKDAKPLGGAALVTDGRLSYA